jgi:hypothetical protein
MTSVLELARVEIYFKNSTQILLKINPFFFILSSIGSCIKLF